MKTGLLQRCVAPLTMGMAALLLFVGCVKTDEHDEPMGPIAGEGTPVAFDTYLLRNDHTTRSTFPDNSYATADMTTDDLQHTGFGVFARNTGASLFKDDKAAEFDFMFNQEVTWDNSLTENVTQWVYQPTKYWPNDNNPADDQDNDTGSDPAQGQKLQDRVSFFAYAPFVSKASLPGGAGDDDGIIGMTDNDVRADQSYVTYRVAASMKPSESVDLLWASQPDRYKLDGAGYTNGTVKFNFLHALSKLTVNVRAVIDHVNPDDTWPEYSHELEANTKVLIKNVQIVSPTLCREGQMYLAPQTEGATLPTWEPTSFTKATELSWGPTADGFTYPASCIHDDLRFLANPAPAVDAESGEVTTETAKTAFDGDLPVGVTHEEHTLFSNTADPYYIFLPMDAEQDLTVRVSYVVITYDTRLSLNDPKYFSIVENNDIEYTAPTKVRFEANKIYTLRLLLGLTSVKFDVDVEDWEVPITFDPVVVNPDEVTREANVE